jgi:hypothetical protein
VPCPKACTTIEARIINRKIEILFDFGIAGNYIHYSRVQPFPADCRTCVNMNSVPDGSGVPLGTVFRRTRYNEVHDTKSQRGY